VEALVQIFRDLEAQGAANINLVTADHFIPQVAQAIRQAKDQGFSLPFIYNTSSYVRVEALRMLDGLVDVYLPDMKYMDSSLSLKYSNAKDYFDVGYGGEVFPRTGLSGGGEGCDCGDGAPVW
jgi:putative pyruvate formate lyase activating enzyme